MQSALRASRLLFLSFVVVVVVSVCVIVVRSFFVMFRFIFFTLFFPFCCWVLCVRLGRSAQHLAAIPNCYPSCHMWSRWKTTRPSRPVDSAPTPLFMTWKTKPSLMQQPANKQQLPTPPPRRRWRQHRRRRRLRYRAHHSNRWLSHSFFGFFCFVFTVGEGGYRQMDVVLFFKKLPFVLSGGVETYRLWEPVPQRRNDECLFPYPSFGMRIRIR